MTLADPPSSGAERISALLRDHYGHSFAGHGPTSEGVDWGPHVDRHIIRIQRSLAGVLQATNTDLSEPTILDVGCGYGATWEYLHAIGLVARYTGIDLVPEMISAAEVRWPENEWICGDFLTWESHRRFDFVLCNGVLTQKLTASDGEMDAYLDQLVRRMFSMANRGISFNVMSTHANYYADNLYYRDPGDVLDWCATELSPFVSLDQSYGLYEFTVHVSRQ